MTNRAKDEALAVKIFDDKYALAKSLRNRQRRASAGQFMLASTPALSPPLARLSLSFWKP